VRYLPVTLENFPVSVDRFSTGAVSEFIEQINACRAQELKRLQSVPSTKAVATTILRFAAFIFGCNSQTSTHIENCFRQAYPVRTMINLCQSIMTYCFVCRKTFSAVCGLYRAVPFCSSGFPLTHWTCAPNHSPSTRLLSLLLFSLWV
jgi:hypothetical protein